MLQRTIGTRSWAHCVCLSMLVLGLALYIAGCAGSEWDTKSFFDQTEMGRSPSNNNPEHHEALLVPILSTLDSSGYDEPNAEFPNAVEVRPEDLKVVPQDYVISKNDLIQVQVTDVSPGVETVKTVRVLESGTITVPLVGAVVAAGLTEPQLEDAIKRKYSEAAIIKNPNVSATVIEARGRTFQIRGAIARPGQYAIINSDFKMMDALILAGDIQNTQGIRNIYVVRPNPLLNTSTQPSTLPAVEAPSAQPPGPDILEPKAPSPRPLIGPDILEPRAPSSSPAASVMTPPGTLPSGTLEDAARTDAGHVYINGNTEWAPPGAATSAPSTMPVGEQPTPEIGAATKPFEFAAPPPEPYRVIRVPLDKLVQGDMRYNVVIRPNDIITVPAPATGEFYMGGHVQRVGVYSLTARELTLKQAIVSAGMLDTLAIPEHTDLIRRIGDDKELFYRIDLGEVFEGRQPDIFLKPYDTILVGTNAIAPFWAAVRTAFRFTYGAGFTYDQNWP